MTGKSFTKDCEDCGKFLEVNAMLKTQNAKIYILFTLLLALFGTGWFTVYKYSEILEKYGEASKSIVSIDTSLKMAVPNMQRRITELEHNERNRLISEIRELKKRKSK